jgi:hypothetical protein
VDDVTLFGLPADVPDQRPPVAAPGAAPPVRLMSRRRADPLAGVALVLAGVAAAVSLSLPWRQGKADTGLSLVRRGVHLAVSEVGELGLSGLWQPLAIVLGGGVLLLLGLLMFRPARTHRFLGVLALLVAAGVVAGVLFRVAQADWSVARFDLGLWCAVAVGVLGVLGALKAMLTAPLVRIRLAPPR